MAMPEKTKNMRIIRRMLSIFLAFLMTAAVCTPAVMAAETRKNLQRQATLGELIEMDLELMKNIYTALQEKLPESSVPAFQREPELWALAMTLATQKSLIGVTAWAEAQNVIISLRQGKKPTPAQEELKLDIRAYDLQVYRSGIENSIPSRWSEIAEPTAGMKAQLKASGGKTIPPAQRLSLAPYMKLWVPGVIHKQAIDSSEHYLFYPAISVFIGMGYAAIWFQVIYTGNTSLTIDGISQIELKDKRSSTVFAGGSVGGEYENSYFRSPIHVDKGESAYFLLLFDPGTWYDINFTDLYDTNGEATCAVQAVIVNHNAEAAESEESL